jgi:hypothetical protein
LLRDRLPQRAERDGGRRLGGEHLSRDMESAFKHRAGGQDERVRAAQKGRSSAMNCQATAIAGTRRNKMTPIKIETIADTNTVG